MDKIDRAISESPRGRSLSVERQLSRKDLKRE